MGLGIAALGIGGLASAGASIYGANAAANAQEKGASAATNAELSMFNTIRGDLSPYMSSGMSSFNELEGMLNTGKGGLLAPFNPTMKQLAATPGYQFTLDQGEQAVNNANAAKGWGMSGPGEKGIAGYAAGLASQTYEQQFQNYWQQQQARYNMLMGPSALGESAAAQSGAFGTSTAGTIGGNIIGGANAAAGADIGTANAISGGINNNMLYYMMMNGGMNGLNANSSSAYSGPQPITVTPNQQTGAY